MFLKKPFISVLLVGSIMAILTAGCGRNGQTADASMSATTTTAATTKTTDPSVAATMTADTTDTVAAAEQTVERPTGWSEASHSNDSDPNYDLVFPQDKVNQVTITIDPENWAAMQANMVTLFGEAGTGSGRGGAGIPGGRGNGQPPPGGGMRPPEGQPPAEGQAPAQGTQPSAGGQKSPADEMQPPEGGEFPGGGEASGRMGGNPDMTPVNPTWVEGTITFNGETWTHVGVRYKGNSTLTKAWQSGSAKLPLKLDFDEFEDEYPTIDNQRFYGFKQLSLANNLDDATYLHDTLAYNIMEDAGLVTPETAFYEVILDYGEGPMSLGLYTAVEVVDDTVIERSFADADGNIYEADGTAASLAAGTDGQIETSFQKENNKDAADWSDIQVLYDALHATIRTSDPAKWRANLETVFDVDTFLEWLAMNAVIQDWDTYGAMSHNYYLYHDPSNDRLVWISWDHNEAFSSRGRGDTSLDKASVGDNWPLIRYLLDDPIYEAAYLAYLQSALTDAFVPGTLVQEIDTWAKLLQPYAEKADQTQSFDSAITDLKAFVSQRAAAIETFLAQQN